jgi:hypothetical protein
LSKVFYKHAEEKDMSSKVIVGRLKYRFFTDAPDPTRQIPVNTYVLINGTNNLLLDGSGESVAWYDSEDYYKNRVVKEFIEPIEVTPLLRLILDIEDEE